MRAIGEVVLGIALAIVGVVMLLSNVNVGTLRFYSIGDMSTAPILLVLLVILIVVAIVKPKWYTWAFVGIDVLAMVVALILGTTFTFKRISALTLVIIVVSFAVGLGFLIKGGIDLAKKKKKDKYDD